MSEFDGPAESGKRTAHTRATLLERLARAFVNQRPDLVGRELELLPDTGLAHDHVRIIGTGWLARVPKQSQMQLSASENLAYQRACYERGADGGHTPILAGVLDPSVDLPRGALLVEEVIGRPAALPDDLPAIAVALAGLHALGVPPRTARAPIQDYDDPFAALCDEIETQAKHLDAADLEPDARSQIDQELRMMRSEAGAAGHMSDPQCSASAVQLPEVRLISFDAHPGNFLVRTQGKRVRQAVLVDLEKCRYSAPPLDLAHATLFTSTTWDVATYAELSVQDIAFFYQDWAEALGATASDWQPWLIPFRRAMWLWSVTWCAKWRVAHREGLRASADGEDWSGERSEQALVTHVKGRVDLYLSAACITRCREELKVLSPLLSKG